MIISFTVTNFKSIKTEQTLDLYTENFKDPHIDNVALPLAHDKKFGVLKTLGIYGANASGKSNMLNAFKEFQDMVIQSRNLDLDEKIPSYKPFKLCAKSQVSPTIFELEFIGTDQLRYIYKVVYSKYQIEEEKLDFYPKGKITNLFTRKTDKNQEFDFKPGNSLKGSKRVIPCMRNNLYLSVAANTEGAPEIIKDIYRFIKNRINYITPKRGVYAASLLNNDRQKELLTLLLSCADTGIDKVERKEVHNSPILENIAKFPKAMHERIKEDFKYEPIFRHHGNTTEEFMLQDESTGTKRLYKLALLFLNKLPNGETVIIDEISNSMHPEISKFLISLFNDSDLNPNNAQLIFTTHDVTLMDQNYMRREQIWFTEKDSKGETELYCLNEFKQVRSDTSFAKWYRERRFNALPKIDFQRFKKQFIHFIQKNMNGDS